MNTNSSGIQLTKLQANLDVLGGRSIDHVVGISGRAAWELRVGEAGVVAELILIGRYKTRIVECIGRPCPLDGRTLVWVVSHPAWVTDSTRRNWCQKASTNCLIQTCPLPWRRPIGAPCRSAAGWLGSMASNHRNHLSNCPAVTKCNEFHWGGCESGPT